MSQILWIEANGRQGVRGEIKRSVQNTMKNPGSRPLPRKGRSPNPNHGPNTPVSTTERLTGVEGYVGQVGTRSVAVHFGIRPRPFSLRNRLRLFGNLALAVNLRSTAARDERACCTGRSSDYHHRHRRHL